VSLSAQEARWWRTEQFQAGLELSADQIRRLDEVYRSSAPKMRAEQRTLASLERELTDVVRAPGSEEADVEAVVARVGTARADLNKTRTLMLFRMYRILTREQNARLDELFERMQRERRRKDLKQ
jgi:Spy/CpxP family protein refolding chaperone